MNNLPILDEDEFFTVLVKAAQHPRFRVPVVVRPELQRASERLAA
jgi:hypothetical protein